MSDWGRCKHCREPIFWGVNPKSGRPFPYDDEDEDCAHFDSCEGVQRVADPTTGRFEQVTTCRECGASVFWSTTYRGRRRPMDLRDGVPNGWCHWDTCRGASGRQYRDRDEATQQQRTRPPTWMIELQSNLGVLELTWPCTRTDMKVAFRRLALQRHPDTGGEHSKFIELKRAYDRTIELMDLFFPIDTEAA